MRNRQRAGMWQTGKRTTIVLACCAGVAAIAVWSLEMGPIADQPIELAMSVAGGQPVESAMSPPEAGPSTAVNAPEAPSPAIGKKRSRVRCAGCAVVESMRRIDPVHALKLSCDAGESTRHRDGHIDFLHPERDGFESLATAVASVIAGDRGRRKMAARTRHQIVLRYADGSKQVLDEATPRNLNVGERIMVISGADAQTVVGIQTASSVDR